MMLRVCLVALLLAGGAAAATRVPDERETSIPFAGNGLRDWRSGPSGSDIVYVRDRTERWYRVKLSGPCGEDLGGSVLIYTTDALGTFDRFSSVRRPDAPSYGNCSVESIRASAPPPDRPRAHRRRR